MEYIKLGADKLKRDSVFGDKYPPIEKRVLDDGHRYGASREPSYKGDFVAVPYYNYSSQDDGIHGGDTTREIYPQAEVPAQVPLEKLNFDFSTPPHDMFAELAKEIPTWSASDIIVGALVPDGVKRFVRERLGKQDVSACEV